MSEPITHVCKACAAGFYEECHNPQQIDDVWIIPCIYLFAKEAPAIALTGGGPGRPALDPSKVTDARSTGRKRAVMMMPILTGQLCGWAGLKFAGGGVIPIVGCAGNTLADVKNSAEAKAKGANEVGHRHHGPDKNTLNNSPGVNLHGICSRCHTRWHAANDEFYDEAGRPSAEFPFVPVEPYYAHDPVTTATNEERDLADEWWALPRFERGPYPFTPEEGTKMLLPLSATPSTLDHEDNPFPETSPFTELEN